MDAGAPRDAGLRDAGTVADAGAGDDAGAVGDGGPQVDAGAQFDGGSAGDGGLAHDGGGCPAAGAVAGMGCSILGDRTCAGDAVLTCVGVGACTVWEVRTACDAAELTCGMRVGTPACQCRANADSRFYADAHSGSLAESPPFPTGVDTPPRCRFRKLGDALASANAYALRTTTAATAVASGRGSGTMTFDRETFPLEVREGVALTTSDQPLNKTGYTVVFNSNVAPLAVRLFSGSSISGLRITNGRAARTDRANFIEVAATGSSFNCGIVTINTVALEGAPASGGLVDGVLVAQCAADLRDTDIRQMGGAALAVSPFFSTGPTRVTGGTFRGNGRGVTSRGDLVLDAVNILDSQTEGVSLDYGAYARTSIRSTSIRNSGTFGIDATSGSPSAPLAVVGGEIAESGIAGIRLAAHTTTLDGVNVHDNRGHGLWLYGSARVEVRGNAHFDANGHGATPVQACGIDVGAGGTLTVGPGATLSGDARCGLSVSGGAAVLHGARIENNGQDGISLTSGSVRLDQGGTVSGHSGAGISATGGTLTLDGTTSPLVILQNTLGVQVAPRGGGEVSLSARDVAFNLNGTGLEIYTGAAARAAGSVDIDRCTFAGNIVGISIYNRAMNGFGQPITIDNSLFTSHTGVTVHSSAPYDGSETRSLSVTGSQFRRNPSGLPTSIGIMILVETVTAIIRGNTITGLSDLGVYIEGRAGSSLVVTDNLIAGNGGPGAFHPMVGGVFLGGSEPEGPGAWSFLRNRIRNNFGPQVIVLGRQTGGRWRIGPESGAKTQTRSAATSRDLASTWTRAT